MRETDSVSAQWIIVTAMTSELVYPIMILFAGGLEGPEELVPYFYEPLNMESSKKQARPRDGKLCVRGVRRQHASSPRELKTSDRTNRAPSAA